MPNIGFGELVLVALIVLLVFGGNRLGQVGKGLGEAIRNFRRGVRGDDDIDVTPGSQRLSEKRPETIDTQTLKDDQHTRS